MLICDSQRYILQRQLQQCKPIVSSIEKPRKRNDKNRRQKKDDAVREKKIRKRREKKKGKKRIFATRLIAMCKGAGLTLTGSAVNFLFRSLSLCCRFDSRQVSSTRCCFLSSLRWLSEIYTDIYYTSRGCGGTSSLLLFLLLFLIRSLT